MFPPTDERPAITRWTSSTTTSRWPTARCAASLGRPMILKRFVKGITVEAVFQKQAPQKRPEWVDVAELRYASGTSAAGR